jgi:hypothetical protein
MNTPTPREEFEEWLETVIYDNSNILSPSGLAWEAWQAAQKRLTEQRDRLLEEREQWRLSSVCRELVEQRDRLAEALQKLADCDWVISLPDRMDAVRSIAREALQSLTPNA